MKRHLMTLLLHAGFFLIAIMIGIYGVLQHGFSNVESNTQKGSITLFILIYLLLAAGESFVREKVLAKKPLAPVALAVTMALASAIFAFIIFLFAGYLLGDVTDDRFMNAVIAIVLFLAIEFPIRFGLERVTRRLR
ncbi:MAG: hypothetical protein AAB250_03265 [Bdellovibrionota bacterium]